MGIDLLDSEFHRLAGFFHAQCLDGVDDLIFLELFLPVFQDCIPTGRPFVTHLMLSTILAERKYVLSVSVKSFHSGGRSSLPSCSLYASYSFFSSSSVNSVSRN